VIRGLSFLCFLLKARVSSAPSFLYLLRVSERSPAVLRTLLLKVVSAPPAVHSVAGVFVDVRLGSIADEPRFRLFLLLLLLLLLSCYKFFLVCKRAALSRPTFVLRCSERKVVEGKRGTEHPPSCRPFSVSQCRCRPPSSFQKPGKKERRPLWAAHRSSQHSAFVLL
jgi:hypothetical protein